MAQRVRSISTAGRAALITGQHPFRTGLLTIGMPGAEQGLQEHDKMELVSEKKQDRRMRWASERLTAANYHSLLVERVA